MSAGTARAAMARETEVPQGLSPVIPPSSSGASRVPFGPAPAWQETRWGWIMFLSIYLLS